MPEFFDVVDDPAKPFFGHEEVDEEGVPETRLSLASRHAPGGNEVAATLAALKSLVLKGCIVTADALHCHPAMAAGVRATGAHYALKLKANNAPLFACVMLRAIRAFT